MKSADHFAGCLVGGGLGDALAFPIEFMHMAQIEEAFGPDGVRGFFDWNYYEGSARGCFTDDTQMTLFTADGLIRSWLHAEEVGDAQAYERLTFEAYQRWFTTQRMQWADRDPHPRHGWLFHLEGLHRRMAPGNTCMTALESGYRGGVGSDERRNDSKGCGTVMRLAPAGLLHGGHLMDAWGLGCDLGAVTHGHQTGIESGGAFAVIIDAMVEGLTLSAAMDRAMDRVSDEATCRAIAGAAHAAEYMEADVDSVQSLGAGWVAEEALGIALFCALKHPNDFRAAVLLAANHSGDSDSTAAICGNLVGLMVGLEGIPSDWRRELVLGDVLEQVGRDLHALRTGGPRPADLAERYPLV